MKEILKSIFAGLFISGSISSILLYAIVLHQDVSLLDQASRPETNISK